MNYLAEFYRRFTSEKSGFQIAQRSYFIVSFNFGSIKPPFEKNIDMSVYNDTNTQKHDFITFLAQSVDLPKLSVSGGSRDGGGYSIVNFEGQAKGPGQYIVLPDGAKSIDIKFLDTETPIHEFYFYPWMNEVASSSFIGEEPFTRATVHIDVLSNDLTHIKMTYSVFGAYPHSFETPDLKTASGNTPMRSVTFDFNNMKVMKNNGVIAERPIPEEYTYKLKKIIQKHIAVCGIENDKIAGDVLNDKSSMDLTNLIV
jgi:hypothetical protein